MSQTNIISQFHTDIYEPLLNDEYILSLPSELTEIKKFLLNILLVLSKARLTYRADIQLRQLNKFLIDYILDMCDNMTISNINHQEPFLYLKSNEELVSSNLSTDESIGIMLGYPCPGTEYYDTAIDRYLIATNAVSNETTNLYASCCPVKNFDDNVKTHILQTIMNFDEVLLEYGYKCNVSIHSYPANSYPHFEEDMFEELFNI